MEKLSFKTIALIILTCGIVLISYKYKTEQRNREAAQNVMSEMADSVDYYQNKEGIDMAQKKVLEIDVNNLEEYSESLGIDNKALKDQVGNLKNLVTRLKGEISAYGEGNVDSDITDVDINKVDSVSGNFTLLDSTEWNNSYLSLNNKYQIIGRYRFTKGALYLDSIKYMSNFAYKYKIDFTSTSYWMRENKWKIWKDKVLVTDIELSDPNASVTDMQSIKILPPPKKFYEKTWFQVGVGFVAGAILIK